MAIIPAKKNFTVDRRADFSLRLTFKDGNGDPINLGGYTVAVQCWDKPRKTKYADWTVAYTNRTGGIVDIRNNTVSAGEYAARVASYNTKYSAGSNREFTGKYGSIAYFSNNTWNVDAQTYNITESRVAVQSETIPVPSASGVYSIGMRWRGSAINCDTTMYTDCLKVPPMYSNLFSENVYPEEIPMSIELNPNATVFAFADLDIGLENIHIGRLNSGAGKHQNIVQQGELVRYRVLANGDTVSGTDITVKDSHGNELYNLTTDQYGMTPQIVLASDFHLDFTGFGTYPDGLVTDPVSYTHLRAHET